MKIFGLQKLTLLDFPEHTAATVFTGGCNLRCPFCHNAPLVTGLADFECYEEDYVLDFLKKRRGVLDGLAVTGGEPLLQPDIRAFLEKVRSLGFSVKLDTNGCFPEKLKELVKDGIVDYVAMDVKNSKEKYALTAGKPDLDLGKIEESVEFLKAGPVPFEFRTTVVKELHEVDDIGKIGQWIRGAKRYFLQNFVDSGDLIGTGYHPHDKAVLKEMLEKVKKDVPEAGLRGV